MENSPVSFKGCCVALSKANSGDFTQREIVAKFNRKFKPEQTSKLSESVNFFIPAAGEGTRFKIAKLLGNYNKINMPIPLCNGDFVHPLDFVMMMSKSFIGANGVQTIVEDAPKGSFSGIVNYYSRGNEIKDTIVCTADSVFDEDVSTFFKSAIDNPKVHLLVVGAKRPPAEVENKYGILDINSKTRAIKRFIEKPDIETAGKFAKNGNNVVNTGCYYFSKDVMKKLLGEIQSGENHIKKNDKELYDYALAIRYVHSRIFDWFKKKPEDVSFVKLSDDWADIGEPPGFYQFAKKIQEGNFVRFFPEQMAQAVKRTFSRIFHPDAKVPYMNFSNLRNFSPQKIANAVDISGIKIIV